MLELNHPGVLLILFVRSTCICGVKIWLDSSLVHDIDIGSFYFGNSSKNLILGLSLGYNHVS